jgi:hypothetical protein
VIEPKFFAPLRAVTKRSLLRRRQGRHYATMTSRRAISAVTAATLLAGGIALAQRDEPARAVRVAPVSAATVEAAAAAPAEVAAPAAEAPPAPPVEEKGPAYRVVAADGGVFTHGWYGYSGSAAGLTTSPITGVAQTADGEGYWLSSADGGVFAFGTAGFFGSAAGLSAQSIVDMAATPASGGYWLVSRNGGVFTFGDAPFFGALVDTQLARPIVSIAATPSGQGYWLVSGDGGVFTFGDAKYFGGMVDQTLNSPIMDLVPTATGGGYYLVSADGGVFAFGDAPFFGAAAKQKLNKPIVDMSITANGRGYWLVASDGGVFTFGEAPFLGAPSTATLSAPVVGIVAGEGTQKPAPEPQVVAASAGAAPVAASAAAPVPAPAPAPPAAAAAASRSKGNAKGKSPKAEVPLDGKFGWDISYPQCGSDKPGFDWEYSIIGINGGRAFKHNRCLAEQWDWAKTRAAGVYVNVNFPRSSLELAMGAQSERQPNCNGSISCVAYNFGWNGIHDSLAYAESQGVDAPFIWLDVEQLNYWTPDPSLNAVVLRGAIDAVRHNGLDAGVYSTPYQYNKIMGGEVTGLPVWTAGADGTGNVARYCAEKAFGGGPVALVQLLPGRFDPNFACPGAGPMGRFFRLPS